MESTLRHRDTQLPGWKLVHNDFGGLIYSNDFNLIFTLEPGTDFAVCTAEPVEGTNLKVLTKYKDNPVLAIGTHHRVPRDHAQGLLKNIKSTLESVVTTTIEDCNEEYPDYNIDEIMSDPDFYADLPDGYTLRSMRYADRARGNCGSVAIALHVAGYTDNVITLNFKDGAYHSSGTLADDDYLVLDYTARQYDTKAPFPLIASKKAWLGWVEAKVLTRYYTTIDNIDISSM